MCQVAVNWQKKRRPESEEDPSAQMITETMNAFKQITGITTDKYLRASNLAVKVGNARVYEAMHKFASKYIHQTAFSILLAYEKGVLNMMDWNFFQQGAFCCEDICKDLTLYVEKAQSEPRDQPTQ